MPSGVKNLKSGFVIVTNVSDRCVSKLSTFPLTAEVFLLSVERKKATGSTQFCNQ